MGADSNLPKKSAVELRALIGSRQLSPVELIDACIDRIERYNPAVNAIAGTDFDRARAQARMAEEAVMRGEALGPLHGLPLGVKDMEDTQGLLTTYGNIQFRDHVPNVDGSLVARLRRAGAIVTAKTNVPDMAAGANTRNAVWGATGNPFDPLLNAGGSSGGSAVALACDMLPLCSGSDLGGSLRIPAALCGVVGLRPSPGLIANRSRKLGWCALPVLGPMARNVSDTALLLSASMGFEPSDPLSYPPADEALWPLKPSDISKLRVGYTDDFGFCTVDPDTRDVFSARLETIRSVVATCEPLDVHLEGAGRAFDLLRAEYYLGVHAEAYLSRKETLGPNVRENIEMFAGISLSDVAWGHVEQTRISRHFADLFQRYDVIVAPTSPVSAFPWTELYPAEINGIPMRNYYQWAELTYVVTLATNPVIALPCGIDKKGMPFGLQVIGPLRGERELLRTSMALETLFERPLPDMDKLEAARPELKSIVTHPPSRSNFLS